MKVKKGDVALVILIIFSMVSLFVAADLCKFSFFKTKNIVFSLLPHQHYKPPEYRDVGWRRIEDKLLAPEGYIIARVGLDPTGAPTEERGNRFLAIVPLRTPDRLPIIKTGEDGEEYAYIQTKKILDKNDFIVFASPYYWVKMCTPEEFDSIKLPPVKLKKLVK